MESYSEESAFARENLDSKEYKRKIEELETELESLADDLRQAKIDVLYEIGYELLEIDGSEILVPTGITMEQLLTTLQQFPPDMDSTYELTYLVSEEDRAKVSEKDAYQNVVQKRQDVVDKVHVVYHDFWTEVVREHADSDKEAIIYMMAGLERSITSSTMSDVIDVPERRCRGFYIGENGDVVEETQF